jgi:hypothetical protein
MKNNFNFLSLLLILSVCYKASSQEQAFNEGDRILTVGVSGGYSKYQGSLMRPSMTFDYGLKGTNGLLSLGVYGSYFSKTYLYGNEDLLVSGYYSKYKQTDFSLGARLAIHYPYLHKKIDFYAGLGLGINKAITSDYLSKSIDSNGKVVVLAEFLGSTVNTLEALPFAGFRYNISKTINLNLEATHKSVSVGLGVKF